MSVEKEVKVFRTKTNFGEIEMCLGEQLSFYVVSKSSNSELFALNKIVNY